MKIEQQAYSLENGGLNSFYEKNNKESIMESFKAVLERNHNTSKDEGLAFILNTLEHYQNESVFYELWTMLEDYESTYRYLLEFIHLNPDYTNLLRLYLEKKFNLSHVEDVLAQINVLLETSPFLLKNPCFQKLAIQRTANAVGSSSDFFKAASAVKAFEVTNLEVDFSKVKNMMMFYSEIAFLGKIELHTLTLKDIDTFVLFSTGKLSEKELKDKRIISKFKILNVLHVLFNTPVVSVEVILQQLSPGDRKELREVLKNLLRNHLSENYFQHLLAAFDNEEGSYYYPQLIAYLSKNADDPLMLSFIKWTSKNLQFDHHYHRALKDYLKSHPRSIWKKKTARKELQMITNVNFRKLLKEVQHENMSPVIKLFKRYGLQLSSAMVITLAVGCGLYLGYDLFVNKKDHTAVTKASKPPITEPLEVDTTLDSFKKWLGENPFVFNVNGEQQKLTFGQGNPTGGKSLVLTHNLTSETALELAIDSEVSPFDEKGLVKEGFSLYHTEYDFDANGNPEIVIMALSQTFESFIWVYSPIVENGIVSLRAELAIKGMSAAKLVDNSVKLLGEQGQTETYTYINQQFVKQ